MNENVAEKINIESIGKRVIEQGNRGILSNQNFIGNKILVLIIYEVIITQCNLH